MNYEKELKKWQKRRERIEKLYNSGLKKAEIAVIYKISKQRVGQILEKKQSEKVNHLTK